MAAKSKTASRGFQTNMLCLPLIRLKSLPQAEIDRVIAAERNRDTGKSTAKKTKAKKDATKGKK